MKVSLNWAQHYSSADLKSMGVPELIKKIGSQLCAVEEVVDWGKRYDGIIVVKIVSCTKHPGADKLSICKIDDGGVVKNVTRDDKGLVQVVCGAPNAREGILVAWLPPGSTVPSTLDKDHFVLEARDFRGELSNGMLASAAELAISNDHDGLLEIGTNDLPIGAGPGLPFNQAFWLDGEVVLDCENKMFTHRPDCFGILGFARELAGIQQQQFTSPQWYTKQNSLTLVNDAKVRSLIVHNEIPELVPRYMAVVMNNVKVGPSPAWIQFNLMRVGVRPVNNVVDVTNYIMLITGQPLHAFDFDKVAVDGKAQIVVRKPKEGEKITLLDGRELTPRSDAILICDQDKPIAMGGMMGGKGTEITAETTRVIIECASFDMYNIRRSSMEHGIFTDAVTRFTKNQSPLQGPPVLYRTVQMLQELSPEAQPVGKVIDEGGDRLEPPKAVNLDADFVNKRLGSSLSADDMATLLRNVEFEVEVGKGLSVKPPFWRTDIEIPEDVVEEVGRLFGYDNLPVQLPRRTIKAAVRDPLLEIKQDIRACLSRAGANEVLTYSFVHGELLTKVGQKPADAYQINNALSPDLQYYRLSITPSLLDKVHANLRAGFEQFAIFELEKTHNKQHPTDGDEKVPQAFNILALTLAASPKVAKSYHSAAFYQARSYMDYLGHHLGLKLSYTPLTTELNYPVVKPFEPSRSALIKDEASGTTLGIIGEYTAAVRNRLKLPAFSAGFEIGVDELLKSAKTSNAYTPLSRFPHVVQDATFKVSSGTSYQQLHDLAQETIQSLAHQHGMQVELQPLDIYQGENNQEKHISFRIDVSHPERTLTTDEVSVLLDGLSATVKRVLSAERI